MSEDDATKPPSKRSRLSQPTPLLVSPRPKIVLQPATPTTPHTTPPATPIIDTALLSPPSLKRRSSYKSSSTPNLQPPRPFSAPPKLVTFDQTSPPASSDNFTPWYLSRNSLIARRTGRTVTVPPPPLGESLGSPIYQSLTCLTHHSSTHHLLAENGQIWGV